MPLPPEFEKRLWDAADQLWTNTSLKPSEYATPVLALIFLRYAENISGISTDLLRHTPRQNVR